MRSDQQELLFSQEGYNLRSKGSLQHNKKWVEACVYLCRRTLIHNYIHYRVESFLYQTELNIPIVNTVYMYIVLYCYQDDSATA